MRRCSRKFPSCKSLLCPPGPERPCPRYSCLEQWRLVLCVTLRWGLPRFIGGGLLGKSRPTLSTPWTEAHRAPLSMGFPKQGYWNGLSFPSPEDLPKPRIEPVFPISPALQADSSSAESSGKSLVYRGHSGTSCQVALVVKNPSANAEVRDVGLIPGLGRSPGGRNGNPLQYSCLERSPFLHGLRSLVGWSPWGHTEPDMTEVT